MIAPLLVGALALGAQTFEVPARSLPEQRLGPDLFDPRWILPESTRNGRDLLTEMRALAGLRFRLQVGESWRTSTLGDLVVESRGLDGEARRAWFDALRARAPELLADWGEGLRELLLDDHLHSERWEPDEDHPRDGLLFAAEWQVDGGYGGPWRDVDVDVAFAQAAALVRSDLVSLKAVENDYRTYPGHVGSDYEAIYPLEQTHFRGLDSDGKPTSTLAIYFRCDLPFPFTDYTCRLQILNRFAADGTARTDIYSTSKDFHFLAGRDVFLPVVDSAGEPTAYLLVRHFGFDLDGVPDGASQRAEALRGSLGNLKRKAERDFERARRDFDASPEALTRFRVVGSR